MEIEQILKMIAESDSFLVAERIELEQDPKEVGERYSQLTKALYKRHSIANMTMVGRLGVHYCTREAKKSESIDAELAVKLKETAKIIAYNVSANLWPGWNEPEITIAESDRVNGLDLARATLRFAMELSADAKSLGTAHWLVAAHHLANGNLSEAMLIFRTSAQEFRKAEKPVAELMANGYAALAGCLEPTISDESRKQLDQALDSLRQEGSEEAGFFIAQIQTATKVFLNRGPRN